MKRCLMFVLAGLLALMLFGCKPQIEEKPVIYLYPEEEAEIVVKLDFDGKLTATYPEYKNGWTVKAMPNGTIYDADGREYSYLFWEGESSVEYDFSKGWCVAGEDTVEFLREKLSYMGLTPREYNEFIVYWLPRLQENPYNRITFQQEAYTESARLEITPEPDNILRVFMVYEPLDKPIEVEPQELPVLTREGFTVVEWGGREMK